MKSIAYAGLDVHKESIAIAIYLGSDREPLIETTIQNDLAKIRKAFLRWKNEYDLYCCYEASSCGYVLQRQLSTMGIRCEIAAPSLIPVRPGDNKRKTDRRDAKKLAKLHRADELTFIHIPTEQEESVRSLVRCRETISKEIRQSKHYILKFLQLRGFSYNEGENWTEKHWRYLKGLKFEGIDQEILLEYLSLLNYKLDRLNELDRRIEELAFSDAFKDITGALKCLRGIDTHSAMVLATEIGDFSRFSSAEQLMSYLGLTPGVHISGNSSRHCSITKAGNSRCRHVLVEAAWNYRFKPIVGVRLRARQKDQSVEVIAISWKCQHRLHKKYWKLVYRTEKRKAVVAVARELVGFIWAIANNCKETFKAQAA
jgi:transposase